MFPQKFALLAVCSSLALAACNKDEGNTAATVNGNTIPESKVAAQINQVPAQLRQGREENLRTQILDQLIQRELVLQQAKEMNIAEDETYQQQVANFEDQLAFNMVIQKHLQKALTDEVLMGAYEANKGQLAYPAVSARHILVGTEQEAKDIINIANPNNFAQLAAEKSTGPSAQNGGNLGYFRKEAMVPAFAEVAFNTAKGTIASKPVQTQFGWHVIFVEDNQPNFIPPFEAVKAQIAQGLSQQKAQEYLNNLREGARITFPETTETEKMEETAEPAETPANS